MMHCETADRFKEAAEKSWLDATAICYCIGFLPFLYIGCREQKVRHFSRDDERDYPGV